MSNSTDTTIYRIPARGRPYDVDGIDHPRPTYAPAVWLCYGSAGRAAADALNRWLDPPVFAASAPDGLSPEIDNGHTAETTDLLRSITRVIAPAPFPVGEPRPGPTYEKLHASLKEIMRVPEIRGGQRNDVVTPNLWIVCDLNHGLGDAFFAWLDETLTNLRRDSIVCRTTVVARFFRDDTGRADPARIKTMMAALVERAADVRSNLSSAFRFLVIGDRDRRGTRYTRQDLADAIGNFAEFILLSNAPGTVSSETVPLFTARESYQPGGDPWEHLPIFGSLWLTRIQIKGSDANLRINPELRQQISAALSANASPFWVPDTPAFQHVDLVRGVRWREVDLPSWRTRLWEEAPNETRRMATELDRWLAAATHWRRATLATYVEFGEDIRRHANRSVRRYWADMDQLGALALDDPAQAGGLDLLQRIVSRAIIEINGELAAFPDAGPRTRRLPFIDHDRVETLIKEPETQLDNVLEELGARIARRVHPLQLIILTALCAFMAWRWTVISIRHWNESGFGWIGRQDLPFAIRDPILVALSHRAAQLRDWLEPTPIGSISMLHWVMIGIVLGAIAFDLIVLLIDRWGVNRGIFKLRKRIQTWIDKALHELRTLLAHRETVVNKRELENIRSELHERQARLQRLRTITRNHGVVPLPPDTAFSTNVRLASPAFAPVTAEDVASATMGIRHEFAAGWRTITEHDFVQIVLDQEEPVTARGGRVVHDPRAELEPLVAMLRSRMPVRANVLVPPAAIESCEPITTTFARIVSVPAQSSDVVRDALDAPECADVTFISHEPERVAFVLGLEIDVPAKTIFGSRPHTPAPPATGQSGPSVPTAGADAPSSGNRSTAGADESTISASAGPAPSVQRKQARSSDSPPSATPPRTAFVPEVNAAQARTRPASAEDLAFFADWDDGAPFVDRANPAAPTETPSAAAAATPISEIARGAGTRDDVAVITFEQSEAEEPQYANPEAASTSARDIEDQPDPVSSSQSVGEMSTAAEPLAERPRPQSVSEPATTAPPRELDSSDGQDGTP